MTAHILIVEDNDKMRSLLAAWLHYAGYRVTQAASGEHARELLAQEQFNVVLTDIVMGEVSGIEVLHTARQQPSRPEVILLTGHGSLETAIAAVNEGAYKYLLKPCSPEEVLACVAGAAQRHTSEQQLKQAAATLFSHLHHHTPTEPPPPADTPTTPPPAAPPAEPAPEAGVLQLGPLTIGGSRTEVTLHGRPVHLTPMEYALLRCLATTPGKPQRYRDIVRCSHHLEVNDDEAQTLLKSHIRNLRHKLGTDCIATSRGIGYTLIEPDTV